MTAYSEIMSKVANKIRKYRKFAETFQSFSCYMKNGVYQSDWSLTTAFICGTETGDPDVKCFLVIKQNNSWKSKIETVLLKLFRLTNRNCKGEYQCTKMILTEGGIIKGFDFRKKVVCSLFPSEEEMNRFISRKKYASKIFPTAQTLDTQYENRLLIEELLTDDGTSTDQKFEKILRFCENKVATKKRTEYKRSVFRNDEQVRQVFEMTLENADLTCRRLWSCIQHGDLWDGNVFLNNGVLKFIDFDKMKEHMCIYDILLYIFTEAFANQDPTLLKKYLSGDFRKTISVILEAHDSETIDYETLFVLFLNEMFVDRFQNLDHGFLMQVLDDVESWGIRLKRQQCFPNSR